LTLSTLFKVNPESLDSARDPELVEGQAKRVEPQKILFSARIS